MRYKNSKQGRKGHEGCLGRAKKGTKSDLVQRQRIQMSLIKIKGNSYWPTEQQKGRKERAKKGINWSDVGLGISKKGTMRERFSTVPENLKK